MKYGRALLLWLLFALAWINPALATNYITAVGTQQFTCTIASGATTCTATISTVGSGAFLVYGGYNTATASNPATGLAKVTLTNSTTVTGTRNTSVASATVITGSVIDGDTTNLIKSVQYGTISVGTTSNTGTATITAVTNANAAIAYLGVTTAGTTFAAPDDFVTLSLSGTTLTATRNAHTFSEALTVSYEIIEFQSGALASVQQVSATSSSSVTSWTASLTSVNTSNAICINSGTLAAISTSPAASFFNGALTNGTTFTGAVNTAATGAKTINASIIEFANGVLNSAAQRGTTTLTGVASNTTTITSVVLGNSGTSYLGNTTSVGTNTLTQAYGNVALTNGTTETTTKNSATSNITSSWEVFEFPAFSGGGTGSTNGYPDQPFFQGWP